MPTNDFQEFRSYIEKESLNGKSDRKCDFDYGKSNIFYCTCYTDSYSDFPDF